MSCECDDTDEGYPFCEVHVGCDSNCRALREPESAEEIRAAYEHWRFHGYLSGCAHGC